MTVTSLARDPDKQKSEIIRKIRALDQRMNIAETLNTAGQVIEEHSDNENVPFIHLIVNKVNKDLTLRVEVIGNITQYIVDEIISYILKSFDLIYLELTDPKTGLIKFSLYKDSKLRSDIYPIYKAQLFNFHYAREDGRLLLFFDQGSLWTPPKVTNIASLKKKPLIKTKTSITKKKTIKKDLLKEELTIPDNDIEINKDTSAELKEEELEPKQRKSIDGLSQKEKSV